MRKIILYIAFATIAISWLIGWSNSCGIALLVMSIVLMLFVAIGQFIIIGMRKKHEDNDNREQPDRNYVYWDYESEPGCWAHNDSLFSLMVCRTDKNSLTDVLHVDEGWEVESAIHSEPTGVCLECESTIETRKNGLVFQYNFYWKKKYEWLLQFDFIRLRYDAKYFERTLTLAQQGKADEQTLIGCCYGHVGTQAPAVVQRDEKKALEWWMKAAEQNHKYAMRELALYYWHKGNKEEAMKWHKGNLDLFVISQSAKQAQRQELAEYEAKNKNSSQQFEIIHDLHAGDVIYENLTIRLGCVCLRVLSEPVRVEIDKNTTCWDFTAELLERKLYKWNKESLDIERMSVESFEDDNKYKNYRLCEQVANGRPKLHRKIRLNLKKKKQIYSSGRRSTWPNRLNRYYGPAFSPSLRKLKTLNLHLFRSTQNLRHHFSTV